MSDFSINKKTFDRIVSEGKQFLFMDDEIITYLKKESARSKEKYKDGDVFTKVVLIKDNEGVHLISAGDHFNYYHPVIVQAHSMLNNNCDVYVCGGGDIKLYENGKCEISGVSTSFKAMNSNFLKEAVVKLGMPVSLVGIYRDDVETEKDFVQNSYEQILYLTTHIY